MSVWGARWGLTWGKYFGDVAPPAPPATGKFNALSIAKLGVGFGALAVASIGLLSSVEQPVIEPASTYVQEGHGGHRKSVKNKKEGWPIAVSPRSLAHDVKYNIESDDNEIVEILTIMSALL
jgi:hypothetical protein